MSQENVEVVRRWWATLNKDGTPPLGLCDERIEIRNPASFPNRGPYRGHDGVHEWMVDAWEVIDEPHFEVDEIIDVGDGETIVSVQRTTGRMRYSQLDATDVRWAAVWTISGGRALLCSGIPDQGRGPRSCRAAGVAKETDDPLAEYTDKLDQRFVDRQDSGGSTAA